MEEIINFFVNGVGTCIVMIIGAILNCVNIHVIWTKYERTNTFYRMLIILLCFDNCVLITWINLSLSLAFRLNNSVILQMVPYFSYPFTHMSISASTFMTIAISHERYRAIKDPFKYRQDKNAPGVQNYRLKMYLFIVLFISVAFNIPYFMDLEVRHVKLSVDPNATTSNSTDSLDKTNYNITTHNTTTHHTDQMIKSNGSIAQVIPILGYTSLGKHPYYLKYYRNFARLIVSGVVPFVSLIYFNISIYMAMKKNMIRRRRFSSVLPTLKQGFTTVQQIAGSSVGDTHAITKRNLLASLKRKDEENLSRVFVVIVIGFLVCHTLKFILNFYDGFFGMVGVTTGYRIASYFSNFLVILNSAINTIIYCIMNKKFRSHFWRTMENLLPCIKWYKWYMETENARNQSPPLAISYRQSEPTEDVESNPMLLSEDHFRMNEEDLRATLTYLRT